MKMFLRGIFCFAMFQAAQIFPFHLCADEATPNPNPAPAEKAGLEDLEKWYAEGSQWQVGTEEFRKSIDDARKKIIDQGADGLNFVLGKLDTDKELNRRCIRPIIQAMPDLAFDPLIEKLKDERKNVKANALELLGLIKNPKAAEPVMNMLKDPEIGIRITAVSTLAAIEAKTAIPVMRDLLKDCLKNSDVNHERLARALVEAFGALKAEEALPELFNLLREESFALRFPAQDVLQKFGKPAWEIAAKQLNESKDISPRETCHLLLILGKSDAPGDLKILTHYLGSEDWVLRGHAVKALAFVLNDEKKNLLLELRKSEQNPFVIGCVEEALKPKPKD